MKESVLSFEEKQQHKQLGFPTFKLPASTNKCLRLTR